ncbi:hypothetical protein [uncultured Kordia sp.]|uniref:hypothetical protein n=1 Tax=uncultured Kordia sp. TaxID=507699 RepID=UPI00260ECB9B|nr:hypothetical protein [uncultured Kordia sp.]
MKRILPLLFLMLAMVCFAQDQDIFEVTVDANVENANDANEKEIIALWTAYLQSGEYKNPATPFWDTSQYRIPDDFLWMIDLRSLRTRTPKVQCTVLGVFAVENDHYAIKTSLAHLTEDNTIVLEAILSVYAKKVNGKYVLVNSSQYHKGVWQKKQIGAITYYIHPTHQFDEKDAARMNVFNEEIAKIFKVAPISFDYFVSSYSREIVRLLGYDYMAKIYIPGQTGGVADIQNRIVYAGNNSAYYAHELVHIYTHELFPEANHFWLNEGYATYMDGSGGYDLAWHTKKLKAYLLENPDFEISLSELRGYIPNGEHHTEFRYVIGGLICKKVFEKHGMKGVIDGLRTVDTDDDFFKFIKEKLGVDRDDFSAYVRKIATEQF